MNQKTFSEGYAKDPCGLLYVCRQELARLNALVSVLGQVGSEADTYPDLQSGVAWLADHIKDQLDTIDRLLGVLPEMLPESYE